MRLTDSDKEKIANLRRNGFGYRRIAKFLGYSENTIKSYLRENVIEGTTTPAPRNAIQDYCQNCGIPITQTPNKRKRLYCSDKCRLQAWHREKKKAESEELVPGEEDAGGEDIVDIGETAVEEASSISETPKTENTFDIQNVPIVALKNLLAECEQRQERTLLKLTVDMEIALAMVSEMVGIDKVRMEQMRSEYTLELAQRHFLGKSKTE